MKCYITEATCKACLPRDRRVLAFKLTKQLLCM